MIIAFTGKLGSGKDTAGERMLSMVDLPGRRVSFAAPLKESAAALFDIPVSDWETYKNDPDVQIHLTAGYRDVHDLGLRDGMQEPNVIRTLTAREFLQRYGTEAHRGIFGDTFWVDQAEKKLTETRDDEFVYVTDARFENEGRAVRRAGGMIVRVLGDNEETGGHASEAGLPDGLINFVIDNDIRDDDFANLDYQLLQIGVLAGLPMKALNDAVLGHAI